MANSTSWCLFKPTGAKNWEPEHTPPTPGTQEQLFLPPSSEAGVTLKEDRKGTKHTAVVTLLCLLRVIALHGSMATSPDQSPRPCQGSPQSKTCFFVKVDSHCRQTTRTRSPDCSFRWSRLWELSAVSCRCHPAWMIMHKVAVASTLSRVEI